MSGYFYIKNLGHFYIKNLTFKEKICSFSFENSGSPSLKFKHNPSVSWSIWFNTQGDIDPVRTWIFLLLSGLQTSLAHGLRVSPWPTVTSREPPSNWYLHSRIRLKSKKISPRHRCCQSLVYQNLQIKIQMPGLPSRRFWITSCIGEHQWVQLWCQLWLMQMK